MQDLNLNETQKKLLQWLVEEVRADRLKENEILFIWSYSGTIIGGYQRNVPKVDKITLDALENSDCLVCNKSIQHQYNCALTSKAYQAVKSNFGAPNLSAIPPELKHLDPELLKRCHCLLNTCGDDSKAWDKDVRTATVFLEERLKKLGKIDNSNKNATGEDIVNKIFSPKKSVLKGKLDDSDLQAYRNLYAGMMGVFRNPYAHGFIDPPPEVGRAIILFIDVLLKKLDAIDWD
ncbi:MULTISPECIES: TIGR02391 family protein [Moorena]|uniref:Conserved hypothetical protein CHP02391 domain-containing protein n=1 Tax=Moorena producens 3L TaxID=489825 RepID=F4XNT4_9CYAN|nr:MULTISPECIES: TIGR02391 family protein [Moorena]EGJ33705.1 hypothetical protein LYNGBM3L_25260 [Moorena producens 3L]NEP68020.1 hypothetical protein [Moorena sp. SIO3A5]OLT64256.1 hypothetical protein BI334_03740 [Moorena producens 3L]